MTHMLVVQRMRNPRNVIQHHFIVIWAQQFKLFDHTIESLQYGCSNTLTLNMGMCSWQYTAYNSPPQPQSFVIANDPLGNVMLLDGTCIHLTSYYIPASQVLHHLDCVCNPRMMHPMVSVPVICPTSQTYSIVFLVSACKVNYLQTKNVETLIHI